jgi:hypothetical protein
MRRTSLYLKSLTNHIRMTDGKICKQSCDTYSGVIFIPSFVMIVTAILTLRSIKNKA